MKENTVTKQNIGLLVLGGAVGFLAASLVVRAKTADGETASSDLDTLGAALRDKVNALRRISPLRENTQNTWASEAE
jgi:hypothetical protein